MCNAHNVDKLYLRYSGYSSTNYILSFTTNINYIYNLSVYTYNFDTKQFGSEKKYNDMLFAYEKISPESILFSKGLELYYNSTSSGNSTLSNDLILEVPQMFLIEGKGFRIYLNDFVGNTKVTETKEIINTLSNIKFYVYDFNVSEYKTKDDDLLSYTDVQVTDDNKYYIDIFFDDYLTYMNVLNGDYLIRCWKYFI